MFPVWLAVLFGALIMGYAAMDVPKKERQVSELAADVAATNFIAYRKAVLRYLEANPTATGTISDASLAAYWMPGYIRDPRWLSVVAGGVPYVYASSQPAHGTLESLYRKSSENLLLGRKSAATQYLDSYKGGTVTQVLPAAISNGAIVMMGY